MMEFARYTSERICLGIWMETSRRQPVVVEYFGGGRSVMLGEEHFLNLTPERLLEMQASLRLVPRKLKDSEEPGLGLADRPLVMDALSRVQHG